ncbi:hypothetical protein EMIHUDRAFT_220939 [Emiliania huxleyi CCMP1516]|uniref:Uncharacterized protein n=2 Tax=Emiliania huxleyi TaxID=2903 RepID=A0A0D3HZQ6_EMIH1|nr:hypothetical protein EMIHUDRAFT_220939 [Emiliania huxleyi CCMP1516]EOD04491.1 hypothetical protein EMIHUDRAFT_220939 [Emiliania huxleyi CCMP1516]|eukprot:XP_005756920.1 hypothetical protein EMIHUDRAFT_220939 [Emiliania huxleyi CCMP1516]
MRVVRTLSGLCQDSAGQAVSVGRSGLILRVPARLTWPAKPYALPWALSWVLPWVLPWALLWALPWALPRSAVGQQSAAGGKSGGRGPWTSWPSFAAFLHVAGCNVACTMAAPLLLVRFSWSSRVARE